MQWRPGGDPSPTAARPLVAEGRRYPVASAELTQHLTTERWDPTTGSWRYGADHLRVHLGLALCVDDRSGDDGELAPEIRIEIHRLPSPLVSDLAGRRLDALGSTTGRFGDGAPALDGVEVTLHDVPDPATAVVRIEACYRWQPDRPPRQLSFTGRVRLVPLWFPVKRPEDAPALLDRAFGPAWREALALHEDGTTEFSSADADRRRWYRFRAEPR